MQHVFYAVFDDAKEGEAAILDLNQTYGAQEAPFSTTVHRTARDRFRTAERPLYETRALKGLGLGAGLGGVAGSACGVAFALIGVHFGGELATVAFTAFGGAVLGALAGVLTGAGDPDPKLEKLEEELRGGAVVVTVAAPSFTFEDEARELFRSHGARIVARA